MKDADVNSYLKSLPNRPGVYRYLDSEDELLYVGKAKNLKARVASYFRSSALDTKTLALVSKIDRIETTITASETEALLLEQTQIQAYKPPYNIIFRDDKSYPFICISSQEAYPRISFHRGTKKKTSSYFGPFPSAGSVRDSLDVLQKIFQLRQCENSYFNNRTRPCLQYQIKRCSGPCCGMISEHEYREDVNRASMFLEGKNNSVIKECADKMEAASEDLEFEKAARFRDQLNRLSRIQEQQYVVGDKGDVDVLAAVRSDEFTCIQVVFVRTGRILGNKTFFPKTRIENTAQDVLAAFLPQFYLSEARRGQDLPSDVIVFPALPEAEIIESAFQEKFQKKSPFPRTLKGHEVVGYRWQRKTPNIASARESLTGVVIKNGWRVSQMRWD